MLRRLIIFFILISISFSNTKSNANVIIAFIDLNKVFKESWFGIDYNSKLKEKSLSIENQIKDYKNKVDIEKNDLSNKKNVLSSENYNIKLSKLENEIKRYNESIKANQDELNIFRLKAEKEFFNYLLPIIEKYSKENSIDLIIKKKIC